MEFVLDKYAPDQKIQEKLEMVLNIIRYDRSVTSSTLCLSCFATRSTSSSDYPVLVGVLDARRHETCNKTLVLGENVFLHEHFATGNLLRISLHSYRMQPLVWAG